MGTTEMKKILWSYPPNIFVGQLQPHNQIRTIYILITASIHLRVHKNERYIYYGVTLPKMHVQQRQIMTSHIFIMMGIKHNHHI